MQLDFLDINEFLASPSPAQNIHHFWAGHIRLIDHSTRAKTGMSAKVTIHNPSEDVHPFAGQRVGPSSGQRFFTRFSTAPEDGDPQPVYEGEIMLSWWQHDCYGQHMTLKINDGPDGSKIHPFQNMLTGKDDGEVLAVLFFKIEDDEKVGKRRRKTNFNEKSPVQQSQILCRMDPDFQDWIAGIGATIGITAAPGESPADTSARIVRVWCGVASRAEFSRPDRSDARAMWSELLARYRSRNA